MFFTGSMPSLVTVNNNISLISINIAPSTWLATVVVLFILAGLYIPRLPLLPLPRISWASVPIPRLPSALKSVSLFRAPTATAKTKTKATNAKTLGPRLRGLPYNASLQDFETPASPRSMRQSHSHSPSPSPAVLLLPSPPPAMEDLEAEEVDSDIGSVGGFSPPAWRRLGNGDRNSGFWKHPHPLQEDLGEEEKQFARQHWAALRGAEDSDSDRGREVLEEAIRTRLPLGSLSPMKQLSPNPRKQLSSSPGEQQSLSPRRGEAKTIAVRGRANSMTSPVKRLGSGAPQWMEPREGRLSLDLEPRASLGLEPRVSPELDFRGSPGSDNYFRFAVRAEVQQRTQPIEAALLFVQQSYHSIIKNWRSILTTLLAAFVSIYIMRMLVKPAAPLPAGDFVKVAGIARAFEPLIYFSEPAVAHVHHLQATSIAVWDLAESVRVSGMADAEVIVQSLDAVSETMKRLVLDYTRFHTHVDGDIDG
ncbi:hypothetical protein E4U52_004884 [Claviceps spartinae]|nr:hypothetical protein E4U52_004884 [Claviceps spartinae]